MPKFDVEQEKQKAEEAAAADTGAFKGFQKTVFDLLYKVADLPFLGEHKIKVMAKEVREETKENDADAAKASNDQGSAAEKNEEQNEDAAAAPRRRV